MGHYSGFAVRFYPVQMTRKVKTVHKGLKWTEQKMEQTHSYLAGHRSQQAMSPYKRFDNTLNNRSRFESETLMLLKLE